MAIGMMAIALVEEDEWDILRALFHTQGLGCDCVSHRVDVCHCNGDCGCHASYCAVVFDETGELERSIIRGADVEDRYPIQSWGCDKVDDKVEWGFVSAPQEDFIFVEGTLCIGMGGDTDG